MLIVTTQMRIKNLVTNKDNEDNYLSVRIWLFVADLKRTQVPTLLDARGKIIVKFIAKISN